VAEASKTEEVEVWPEHWTVFRLFCSLQTQWRVGMCGPTGLDYAALYPLLDRLATTDEEWEEMFNDIQVMEREALATMNARE
jgi:hypothetical protein